MTEKTIIGVTFWKEQHDTNMLVQVMNLSAIEHCDYPQFIAAKMTPQQYEYLMVNTQKAVAVVKSVVVSEQKKPREKRKTAVTKEVSENKDRTEPKTEVVEETKVETKEVKSETLKNTAILKVTALMPYAGSKEKVQELYNEFVDEFGDSEVVNKIYSTTMKKFSEEPSEKEQPEEAKEETKEPEKKVNDEFASEEFVKGYAKNIISLMGDDTTKHFNNGECTASLNGVSIRIDAIHRVLNKGTMMDDCISYDVVSISGKNAGSSKTMKTSMLVGNKKKTIAKCILDTIINALNK